MSSKGLYLNYQKAGPDYLAYRLTRIFIQIENDEDRILHNDMVSDVLTIIQGNETSFFKDMAGLIMYPRINRRKRFLFRLAEQILHIGHKMKG